MMKRFFPLSFFLGVFALATAGVGGLLTSPVRTVEAMAVDPCDLPAAWFDQPTLPKYTSIPPNHSANPSDCPFYAPSWQQFLFATNPLPKSHLPAFLGYADFQQVFSPNQGVGTKDDSEKSMMLSLEPRDIERANQPSAAHQKLLDESAALNGSPPRRASLDDTLQAAHGRSVGGTLIDQQGHFIYYAIHANPAMVSFLNANHLTGPDVADHIRSAQPFATMTAPTTPQESLAEYKSAWMIVKDRDSAPTYFVTRARVPRYVVQADGKLVPKLGCLPPHRRETREVWVALLALHVVFTLPGHPEMIWSTFEHVSDTPDGKLVRDNAPAANTNSGDATTATISELVPKYPLFKSGTPATQGNTPLIKPTDAALLASHWDKRRQAFTKNGLLQTSIFRVFPGSKMSGTDSSEDSDVVTVNANATARFNDPNIAKAQGDKRSNYRLVGAIWMDKPDKLAVDMDITNKLPQTTDDPLALVAGEDGLGSTAMESFTETTAPNCFSCHDTHQIGMANKKTMPASMLNLSHLMSKYLGTLPESPAGQPHP